MKSIRLARRLNEHRWTHPGRPADRVIGPPDRPYIFRWFLIPKNRLFNVYLHRVMRSDDDRALHDHPWASLSICLLGFMSEITKDGIREIEPGTIRFRSARMAHRLVLRRGYHCWTLFVTGPVVRKWGFHCPDGWRRSHDFYRRGCE